MAENKRDPAQLLETVITFPGNIPGMNGPKGLLRMGWRKRKKMKETWVWYIASQTKNRHRGAVTMSFIRYSVGQNMDYEGLVSTGKLILDALVARKVILDDNRDIIKNPLYDQKKCKLSEQRTVITFTDYIE